MLTATRDRLVHLLTVDEERAEFNAQVNDATLRTLLLQEIGSLQQIAAYKRSLVAERPADSCSRLIAEARADQDLDYADRLRTLLIRFSPQTIAGAAV